jgi:hypothetical protein
MQPALNDWPKHAVPEAWIDSLFTKFNTLYGARFVDFWGVVPFEEVRRAWGVELRKLSPEQLRAGVATLTDAFPNVPNCAQFLAHCRSARRGALDNAAQLTDQRRADPAQYAEQMARVKAAQHKQPGGVAWAWRLLERGKSASGGGLPPEVIRCAEDAIRNHAARGKGGSDET